MDLSNAASAEDLTRTGNPMNDTTHADGVSDTPWPSSAHQVPDTSMLPGSEKAPPAVVGMLNHAVQGAHDTIDRLADTAAPAAREFGERVSAAEDARHAKTGQWRGVRDEWVESLRTTVRGKPLASMAAAVVLGAVIARITR